MVRVGVLALQGDFAKHAAMLDALGITVQEVRTAQELTLCDGLIIPGGESTAILRQIDFIGMRDTLLKFAQHNPIFGTCAGLIIMSENVVDFPLQPLQLLNISVERNAFGRQIESFHVQDLSLSLTQGKDEKISAFFIRAPRIRSWHHDVQILAYWYNEPVLVRCGLHIASSFHPELTCHHRIHEYFISIVQANYAAKLTSAS